MTPKEKILRDALGILKAGEIVDKWEGGQVLDKERMQRIAGDAIKQADAVKDGPSEKEKGGIK